MLSNTAIPIYYGAFREQVLSGQVPVCEELALEMARIDKRIADPNVYYDNKAIDGFIKFVEGEMTLTNGEDVHMLESFKLWAECLLSWFVFVDRPVWDKTQHRFVVKRIKKRLIDTQYLIVARGSAKTMYVSFLQTYFLTVDRTSTQQITVAPTMVQANEVLSPIKTAITRAKGPLFQFLTSGTLNNTTGARSGRQKLASTKKGIENFLTNSTLEIRPMSIDKCQGLRSKYNSVDEWLSGETRENVINALLQGARKFEDPILVAISSEGTVRNGVGDDIKIELNAILRGDSIQDNVSILIYKLDDVSEVANPAMWPKANPNLGITVSYDTYAADVQRAKEFPSTRNEILAKRFGLPMEGFTYFFRYEETLVHPGKRSYPNMICSLGIDLSRGDDFCAFTWLFPLQSSKEIIGQRFGVKTRSYISQRTLEMLPSSKRTKYDEFIAEGTLIVMEGNILDMIAVYLDFEEHVEAMQYDIRMVGYDVYNSTSFMERYVQNWGPHFIQRVIQGARTESVPLGELKILARDRLLLHDELIMQYTMGNAVVWEDTNGNRKLTKRRSDEKIDNVAALMNAYIAYKDNPDQFI